jgi:hypothetical protein
MRISQSESPPTAQKRGLTWNPSATFLVIELLVLLAILAVAWKARSAMAPVPISDPDSWGYMNPALSWLSGLGLQQTSGRDWLYPAFLAFFLKTTGSFSGIVFWQKFLAMGSGVLMAVTWRGWVSMLPLQRRSRFFASLAGALPILVQLINPQIIFFEMSIRPEGLLPFFVYAQLACLMGYFKFRWRTPKALPSMVLGAAAILLSYACFLLKPSWLFAFVITSAPVFAGLFGRALFLKTRLLTPVTGVVFSFLLLWLPGAVYLIKDTASVSFLPDALFAVHARLIDSMFHARLAKLSDSDPEKSRLQALVTVLESELKVAEVDKPYEKLGFNPDYLMASSPLTTAICNYAGDDNKKFRSFCISCYVDAAFYDPVAFGKKIAIQFEHFLFPTRDTFYKVFGDFTRFYESSSPVWEPFGADRFRGNAREMYVQYKADLVTQSGVKLRLDGNTIFKKLSQGFAWLALPLEILFLITFIASLISPALRDLRVGGWAAFSLFSAPLWNALMVCTVHALDMDRYRHTYGGFLLFSLVAMAVFSFLVVARFVRRAA